MADWQALQQELEEARRREESTAMQLTICRAMLATAMRERDTFEAARDHIAYELARHKRMQRRERRKMRMWITRETKPRISEN